MSNFLSKKVDARRAATSLVSCQSQPKMVSVGAAMEKDNFIGHFCRPFKTRSHMRQPCLVAPERQRDLIVNAKKCALNGNFIRAINLLTEAIRTNSSSDDLFAWRSVSLMCVGWWPRASEDARRALALSPRNRLARIISALIEAESHPKNGLVSLDKLLQENSSDQFALLCKIVILDHNLLELDEAREMLQRCLKDLLRIGARSDVFMAVYALCLIDPMLPISRQPDARNAAIEAAKKALDIRPKNAMAQYVLKQLNQLDANALPPDVNPFQSSVRGVLHMPLKGIDPSLSAA